MRSDPLFRMKLDLRFLQLDMSVSTAHVVAGGLVAAAIVAAANLPRAILAAPAPPRPPLPPAPPPPPPPPPPRP
jgi:hypothetical protein